jgi:DNA-binding LacI/PurR family transcriptional regulator
MPVTIKEIAQRLGLNPSSVSRALSGSDQVSEETRQRVMQVARELNYSPNLMAQSLVGAAHNLIGCMVLEFTNPFYIPMLRAIEDIAGEQDYIIFLSESRRQIEMEKDVIERYRRVRAAGVIVMPVLAELMHLQALEDEGTPVVVVGRDLSGFDSLNVDNDRSGYLVGQHLVSLGHRYVGFVYSGEAYNTPEQTRLAGLRRALGQAGVELELFEVGNNRLDGGERAAQDWLTQQRRPTAVFGSNDLLAMGFVHEARNAGVSVPHDVAVIGHDDIPFADLFAVPLTTIAFPKYEMGQIAMRVLLNRIETEEHHEPENMVLEPELIVRQSCGAAAH